jgi:hypothetical protein
MASVAQFVEQRLKLKVNRQKSVVDRATKRTLRVWLLLPQR